MPHLGDPAATRWTRFLPSRTFFLSYEARRQILLPRLGSEQWLEPVEREGGRGRKERASGRERSRGKGLEAGEPQRNRITEKGCSKVGAGWGGEAKVRGQAG